MREFECVVFLGYLLLNNYLITKIFSIYVMRVDIVPWNYLQVIFVTVFPITEQICSVSLRYHPP